MVPSDTIEEISRQLQEAELTVVAPFGPYLGWADLIVLADSQTDPKTGITVFVDRCIIRYIENQWCFRVWNSIPGPGPESLEHCIGSVEELVAITLQFFLGQPLNIDGWIVPKHRHPEWDESHLRLAIAHAQPLSLSAWTKVRKLAKEHYNRLFRESDPRLTNHPRTVPWNEWYTCLFVPLVKRLLTGYEKPSHEETLWIRRDLQEAYLVQEP